MAGPKQKIIARLGKVPDREIAAACGVSIRRVGQWRHARGIPPYLIERPWTKPEVRLLGTKRDREVAERVDRTPHAVKHKRQKMGITSYWHKRKGLTRRS